MGFATVLMKPRIDRPPGDSRPVLHLWPALGSHARTEVEGPRPTPLPQRCRRTVSTLPSSAMSFCPRPLSSLLGGRCHRRTMWAQRSSKLGRWHVRVIQREANRWRMQLLRACPTSAARGASKSLAWRFSSIAWAGVIPWSGFLVRWLARATFRWYEATCFCFGSALEPQVWLHVALVLEPCVVPSIQFSFGRGKK